jgi:hypothetical protein
MRLLAILALMVPATSIAADCTVRSGREMNPLVELYTSEGCSSCPPADRWISSFTRGGARVVPLAFHVGYWDYIGWKDAYADARFTQRQHDYARVFAKNSVYTPQVVLAGRDYVGWRQERNAREALEGVGARTAEAWIEIAARAAGSGVEGEVSSQVLAAAKPAGLALVVAITQNGLSSRVTAGENRGEKLDHNFVVRDMAILESSGGKFAFKAKPDWNLERMSVVAFLQNPRSGHVLQSLSARICSP